MYITRALAALGALALAGSGLDAQWLDRKTPGIPRLANGNVNLAAAAPRKAGKPDLSGIWQVATPRFLRDLGPVVPGGIPMQPWAEAITKERMTGSQAAEESDAQCLPQGIPKLNATPVPFRIIQNPDEVVILYEAFGLYRQVFMDGRALPPITNPTWLGYSVGRWDGDALVIETTGFNGKAWLDQAGHPATDALTVTERIRRKDFGHLDIQVTIDDAKAYTKPWTFTEDFVFQPDTDILEFVCLENERDLVHLRNK